jgi:hypothetical protein
MRVSATWFGWCCVAVSVLAALAMLTPVQPRAAASGGSAPGATTPDVAAPGAASS